MLTTQIQDTNLVNDIMRDHKKIIDSYDKAKEIIKSSRLILVESVVASVNEKIVVIIYIYIENIYKCNPHYLLIQY